MKNTLHILLDIGDNNNESVQYIFFSKGNKFYFNLFLLTCKR